MHWFPFYGSDFLGATVGLSCLERSLYALMLPLYYEVGPFPNDPVRVYRIVGCESDEQKRAVDYLLGAYFVEREDGWYQARAEEVKIQQARAQAEAIERGKRSAEVRRTIYGTAQPKGFRKAFESLPKGSSKGSRTNQIRTTNPTDTSKASTLPSSSLSPSATLPVSASIAAGAVPGGLPAPPDPPGAETRKKPRVTALARTGKVNTENGKSVATWDAYSAAYYQAYGVPPVRNAKVNSLLTQVVQKLGEVEAPLVAAFYVTHRRAQYTAAKHPVVLLARDAEGLRTDWATRHATTEYEAREGDRLSAQGSVWEKLIAAEKAKEAKS